MCVQGGVVEVGGWGCGGGGEGRGVLFSVAFPKCFGMLDVKKEEDRSTNYTNQLPSTMNNPLSLSLSLSLSVTRSQAVKWWRGRAAGKQCRWRQAEREGGRERERERVPTSCSATCYA